MKPSIITRNYRITLPKNIRERQGISVGDSLFVESKDGVIKIRKIAKKFNISSAFGAWKMAKEKTKEDSVAFVRKLRHGSD